MLEETTGTSVGGSTLVRVAPIPSWVVHDPVDIGLEGDFEVGGGLVWLYHDSQVDLTGNRRGWHWRYGQKVVTRAGAERAAHFAVVFDPTYETLDIHHIRVRRGDTTIDHTRAESFEIIRREQNMERLVLDGRLTVTTIIPDIRAGDVVELCATTYGTHPVLKDRHDTWVMFSSGEPVLERRHRLIHPLDREIAIRLVNNGPPTETVTNNGIVEHRWRSRQTKKFEYEALTPSWQFSDAALQVSEHSSWNEIARLFAPLYEPGPLPDELASAADALATPDTPPAERVCRALFFVQKSMRYLSLSLGEGGLVPRPIEQIWKTGYGDCKDAARLFVAVARRLGIDASPALVSTRHGLGINSWLPTPSAFNHCIARVTLGEKTYWLDPTMRSQAGRLDVLYKPHYGWALPLVDAADKLEHMGAEDPILVTDVDEHIVFGPRVSSLASYECRTSYASWHADHIRDRVANDGAATIGQEMLKRRSTNWRSLKETAPLAVEDDINENRVTLIENYQIEKPWQPYEHGVSFATKDLFMSDLYAMPTGERKSEIYLGPPRVLRRRVRLDLPKKWNLHEWDFVSEGPELEYRSKLIYDGKTRVELVQELTVRMQTMPASSAGQYHEVLKEMAQNEFVLRAQATGDKFDTESPGGGLTIWQKAVGIFILGFWGLMVLGYLLRALQSATP